MFNTASFEEIKAGETTDVYFERTKKILDEKDIHKKVKAEFIAKNLPHDYRWAVFSGLEEVLDLLEDFPVSVRAVPEGTIIKPYEPVLEIEGVYDDFCLYETPILGLICQASGIATKAARCRKAAGDKPVVSFGARRMHPAITPMVERNAYIGGSNGVAAVKSAEVLGIEPTGTMPHALILVMGDVEKAIQAFDEVIDSKVNRVALVDTFCDEKAESLKAARALGDDLYAVRLDTPGSRRGDMLEILKEVRWELDLNGFEDVKLFVSGGINEEKILRLNPVADAYGVGTSISSAATVDYAMDIVEIEGEPVAKRGKQSGSKKLYRCDKCHETKVTPCNSDPGECTCSGGYRNLLQQVMEDGEKIRESTSPQDIREYVIEQLGYVQLEI